MDEVSAAPTVDVTVGHDQIHKAAIWRQSRLQAPFWLLLVSVVAVIGAAIYLSGPLAFLLVQQLSFETMFAIGVFIPSFVMWALGLIGLALVVRLWLSASRRKQLRHFESVGFSQHSTSHYRVEPLGLRTKTDGMDILSAWNAIQSVDRHGDAWVVFVERLFFLIPSAAFADRDAETAFIAAILDRMPQAARDRSPAAQRLVEQGRS